jgi:hypothetical protein
MLLAVAIPAKSLAALQVELEVMVPEKPVARFEKSMEAMHHY